MKNLLTTLRFALGLGLVANGALLHAQSVTPQPTEIRSKSAEMQSTDTETTSLFTGDVIVTGTNLRITCDRLEVVAIRRGDPKAAIGKIEGFKSLVAIGNVRIVQGGREAAAGRAEVLPGEEKITLTGNPVLRDNDVNTTFAGDNIEMHRGQRKVTGTNIRIVGPELKDLGVDPDKLLNPATPAPKQP